MIGIGSTVLIKEVNQSEVKCFEVKDVTIDLHDTNFPVQLSFCNGRSFWFGVSDTKTCLSACGEVELIKEGV